MRATNRYIHFSLSTRKLYQADKTKSPNKSFFYLKLFGGPGIAFVETNNKLETKLNGDKLEFEFS